MRVLSSCSHLGSTVGHDDEHMGTFAKVLIALVIALPMAAYVAGSLVASSSEQPTRREPVIVRDAPEPDTGTGSPTSDPSRPPDDDPDDDPDDEQDDDDGEQDDDRIRKVTPAPTRVGDDDDDRDDTDDRSGRDDDDGSDDD